MEFVYTYSDEIKIENMHLNQSLLLNSCDTKLYEKGMGEVYLLQLEHQGGPMTFFMMYLLELEHQGGPMTFFMMTKHIIAATTKASRVIVQHLQCVEVTDFPNKARCESLLPHGDQYRKLFELLRKIDQWNPRYSLWRFTGNNCLCPPQLPHQHPSHHWQCQDGHVQPYVGHCHSQISGVDCWGKVVAKEEALCFFFKPKEHLFHPELSIHRRSILTQLLLNRTSPLPVKLWTDVGTNTGAEIVVMADGGAIILPMTMMLGSWK
jgi:hypothetical protein